MIVTGRMAEPAHIRLGEYQRAVALFVAQVAKEAVTVSLVGRHLWIRWFASSSWRYFRPKPAVGRKDAMESCQVYPRLWHQRGKPGQKIHRFEYHMRGAMPKSFASLMGQAFPIGCLELVANITGRCD